MPQQRRGRPAADAVVAVDDHEAVAGGPDLPGPVGQLVEGDEPAAGQGRRLVLPRLADVDQPEVLPRRQPVRELADADLLYHWAPPSPRRRRARTAAPAVRFLSGGLVATS